MSDHNEQLTAARRRLDQLVDDPFWGPMLREIVPRSNVVSVALADELVHTATVRAVMDNGQRRGFLAVADGGKDFTLLVVELLDGTGLTFSVRAIGQTRTLPSMNITKTTTIGELVAYLDEGLTPEA